MDLNKKVTVLYASQTGNSEDVAERIGRQALRTLCKCNVCCLSKYPVKEMVLENLLVFVCSTTGDGDSPDTMVPFWRFLLQKNLPSNSLSHVHFCVFGMGDSSYDKFNVVAKKLSRRLLQLGATEFLPLTLADDQHELGYDAALYPWLKEFKEALQSFYNLDGEFVSEDVLLPPRYTVKFYKDNIIPIRNSSHFIDDSLPLSTMKSNDRVTSDDHFQAVHLLKFTIDSSIQYEPGDVAVIWPENPKDEVEQFLSLLKIPIDATFTLIPSDPTMSLKIELPPCTVRECATSYFDIMSIPRRSFFEFFHHFSKDATEKEKLFEFTTALGQEELYDYCNRPRRTILEVLQDFPHTTPYIPFEYFFDMIPSIRPRSFSIASSLSLHLCEFHLIVAVVEYKTRLQKLRRGLCSNWITKLNPGAKIPFSIKHGSITLPPSDNPMIMVGPGTGCAPFKSFLEERYMKNSLYNYLFFGCRYKSKDFLFKETWEEMCQNKILNLFTAFSRDQEDKIYVQHRITENSHLVWDLIQNKKAYIYIAGNAKQMPQSVKDAFLSIIKNIGGLDEEESKLYLLNLEQRQRYQIETWA